MTYQPELNTFSCPQGHGCLLTLVGSTSYNWRCPVGGEQYAQGPGGASLGPPPSTLVGCSAEWPLPLPEPDPQQS